MGRSGWSIVLTALLASGCFSEGDDDRPSGSDPSGSGPNPTSSSSPMSTRGVHLTTSSSEAPADRCEPLVGPAPPPGQPFVARTLAGRGAPDHGDGGPAAKATLGRPYGLAWRDGSLLIVGHEEGRVRAVGLDGTITTVAGSGSAETQGLGDGGPAVMATLRLPRSVAFAPDGALHVADTNHYVVRRIDDAGIITTVAGSRSFEYSGDGGPAVKAGISSPQAIAFDADGNLYIADSASHRIRRVGSDGTITTVAGNGEPGTSGDGLPATLATLNNPNSLAMDRHGGLLIGGIGGTPLRRYDLILGILTTLAGTEGATAIAVDANDDVYFTTSTQVKSLDWPLGTVRVVAGDGTPGFRDGASTQATFDGLRGIAMSPDGTIFVSDSFNDRVRSIRDGAVATVAGTGKHAGDGVQREQAVVFDSQGITWDRHGNLFFTDFAHHTILRLGCDGVVRTVAGTGRDGHAGDGGHPLQARFSAPRGLAFDQDGQMLFIDETDGVGVIRLIRPGADGIVDGSDDEIILTVAGRVAPRSQADHGVADGSLATEAVFAGARGLAVDAANRLYVADFLDHRIRRILPGANGILDGGADELISTFAGDGTLAMLGEPNWLAVDAAGNLFVQSAGNEVPQRIRRITSSGAVEDVVQASSSSFAVDAVGRVYLAQGTQISVVKDGQVAPVAGTGEAGFAGDGGPALDAMFRGAGFLAIASNGGLAVADNGNFRIRSLSV